MALVLRRKQSQEDDDDNRIVDRVHDYGRSDAAEVPRETQKNRGRQEKERQYER
jgi:hypothetical protein